MRIKVERTPQMSLGEYLATMGATLLLRQNHKNQWEASALEVQNKSGFGDTVEQALNNYACNVSCSTRQIYVSQSELNESLVATMGLKGGAR